jgi:hypothetical protein
VEYAQKIKDMKKKLPERFQEAWDEIYPPAPSPSAPAPPQPSKPAGGPCEKCGAHTPNDQLCDKCASDEEGETDKSAFFGFLENMGAMKNKLVAAFGKDEGEGKYYALLGAHGFEKSNEITERDKQIEVYKEMGDLLKS